MQNIKRFGFSDGKHESINTPQFDEQAEINFQIELLLDEIENDIGAGYFIGDDIVEGARDLLKKITTEYPREDWNQNARFYFAKMMVDLQISDDNTIMQRFDEVAVNADYLKAKKYIGGAKEIFRLRFEQFEKRISTEQDVKKQARTNRIKEHEKQVADCLEQGFQVKGDKLIKYIGQESKVRIPHFITEIEYGAFSENICLKTVIIPPSIQKIGNSSFRGCSSLINVIFEGDSRLKIIDIHGFENCTSLSNLVLPHTVKEIKYGAFSGCKALETLSFEKDSILTTIDEYTFSECENLHYAEYDNAYYLGCNGNPYFILVKTKTKNITSCAIHDNTKIIAGQAFSDCHELRTVKFPYCLRGICAGAFYRCWNLNNVILPNSLIHLGENAFYGCNDLEEIAVPQYIHSIANGVFWDCTSLKNVNMHNQIKEIGEHSFDCHYLRQIELPSGIIRVGSDAFGDLQYSSYQFTTYDNAKYVGNRYNPYLILYKADSENIPYCSIHPNTKVISAGAFAGCTLLKKIVIPESVDSIGEYAFVRCDSLADITLTHNVIRIDRYAFGGRDFSLKRKVNFNGTIDQWAEIEFASSESNPADFGQLIINNEIVTKVCLHSAKKVGQYAFATLNDLKEVKIGETVEKIENSAFFNCSSLSTVSFSQAKKLKQIEIAAFGWGPNTERPLTSVAIPYDVELIDEQAFSKDVVITYF